eukprot:NODE_2629_length_1533_cov_34.913475_g2268_i0.p1 GENE.NODE_2629_length_1533_cov_34.913475_g2268_i0~~NODE_2629_length_1533_cov_34.913475_g2268_i0.p1  ORF type:complete len:440 (+),score=42.90 NODE_2629_length_1533_cov_34.913475_g2268_i0:61-1380(+)
MLSYLLFFGQALLLSFASYSVGQFFRKWHLPIITGYLITGILSGPYVLVMISNEATRNLRIVDELALSCIAFAAGAELYLQDLRVHMRVILYTLACLMGMSFTFLLTAMTICMKHTDLFSSLDGHGKFAVCLLVSTVLMARSPASAIAVVKELRASGPFTTVALSVSVAIDVVLIILFSLNVNLAHSLLSGGGFAFSSILTPVSKLIASVVVGLSIGKIIETALILHVHLNIKTLVIVLSGFGIFFVADSIRGKSILSIEPLFTCVACSVYVTNHTTKREEYLGILDRVLPWLNIVFFTLAGASLAINTLVDTWWIAALLFMVRLCSLFFGTTIAGWLTNQPNEHARVRWMAYVTQAGVAMGLAREVAMIFPDWGTTFASLVVSVVVVNEMVGPPCFRYALVRTGEAKLEAMDGQHDIRTPPTSSEGPKGAAIPSTLTA